jgi:hypothetical protein
MKPVDKGKGGRNSCSTSETSSSLIFVTHVFRLKMAENKESFVLYVRLAAEASVCNCDLHILNGVVADSQKVSIVWLRVAHILLPRRMVVGLPHFQYNGTIVSN